MLTNNRYKIKKPTERRENLGGKHKNAPRKNVWGRYSKPVLSTFKCVFVFVLNFFNQLCKNSRNNTYYNVLWVGVIVMALTSKTDPAVNGH